MKEIKLTKGFVAIVDDDKFEELNKFKWYAGSSSLGKFYACRMYRKQNGKQGIILMHRQIIGQTSDYNIIEHINSNPLDNRVENLRRTTRSQIIKKQHAMRSLNKTTDYTGVIKNGKNYSALINIDNRTIYLGFFKTKTDAAIAYNKAAIKYFGNQAKLNEI